MANNLKGDAAKTEVITVRMTKAEAKELTATYGKPALGLRALMAAARIGQQK
jgi:hypothetical protein